MSTSLVQSTVDENKCGDHTVDVAKTTSFALFRMVQTSGPVDCDVAFIAVEPCRAFHAAARADAAKFE